MPGQNATLAETGGRNGIFGVIQQQAENILTAGGEALGNLLPIWAANQLGLQTTDQLDQSTFDGIPGTQNITTQSPQNDVRPAPEDQESRFFGLTENQLILASIGVAALLILIIRR